MFGFLLGVAAVLALVGWLLPPRRVTRKTVTHPPRHVRETVLGELIALEDTRRNRTALTCGARRNYVESLQDILKPCAPLLAPTPEAALALAQLRHGQVADVLSIWDSLPRIVEDQTPAPAAAAPQIVFKQQEPTRLTDYVGQPLLVQRLRTELKALGPQDRVLPHMLLTGLPGLGKTLLAKIIAHELRLRMLTSGLNDPIQFIETYAANLTNVAALDAVVARITHPTVWFIDEIHVLDTQLATKIYLLMEEQRYPFQGSTNPTALPAVMVIGATTDYGRLHPALKRRFGEALMLQPLVPEDLQTLARSLLPRASESAIAYIVHRTHFSGAPHEVVTLCRDVRTYAKANNLETVDESTVAAVCALSQIDQHGLRPVDRKVLQTLATRPRLLRDASLLYSASEADLCALAGLDVGEFQRVIRPRLMARDYLYIRPGFGIALTERALQDYPPESVQGV